MLEAPTDIDHETIVRRLENAYGLTAHEIEFLPLGADVNTAVYKVSDARANAYFVKLRRGDFNEASVIVPELLKENGVCHVIAPFPTEISKLWANIGDFHLMVYPFVNGDDGFKRAPSHAHWHDLGVVLKHLHSLSLPVDVESSIPKEDFTDVWREAVRDYQNQAQNTQFSDPISAELAGFLREKRAVIDELCQRADELASIMRVKTLPYVVCHADIHVGNMLIDDNDDLYVVDWDTLILAPKERDLMFIGAGIGIAPSQEAEANFYQGYGKTEIDAVGITYYRYERIIQDIAAYCEEIFHSDEGMEDRRQGLRFLKGQFLPGNEIEIARLTDERLLPR